VAPLPADYAALSAPLGIAMDPVGVDGALNKGEGGVRTGLQTRSPEGSGFSEALGAYASGFSYFGNSFEYEVALGIAPLHKN
jgi:hypothetical protein